MLHLAPEVHKMSDYTILSDIYACGVTLYRLVNGDTYLPPIPPKKAIHLARLGKFPQRDRYRFFIPTSLRRLINKAINIDPAKRFQSADEMRHALEQQNLLVTWNEKHISHGILWEGRSIRGREYILSMQYSKSSGWCIEFKNRGKWQAPS